jgi:hypothetical protein
VTPITFDDLGKSSITWHDNGATATGTYSFLPMNSIHITVRYLVACVIIIAAAVTTTSTTAFTSPTTVTSRGRAIVGSHDGTYQVGWLRWDNRWSNRSGIRVKLERSNDDLEKEHISDAMESSTLSDAMESSTRMQSSSDNVTTTSSSLDDDVMLSNILMEMGTSGQQQSLPVPVFTGILILMGSLYVTLYGIYVGLYGFPDNDSPLPRIF